MKNFDIKKTSELPLYSAARKLFYLMDDTMATMSKDRKHTLGQELVHRSLRLLDLIGAANRSFVEREGKIKEFLDEYQNIATILKMCTEKKYITQNQYCDIVPLLTNISRQANGWLKATQATNNEYQEDMI